MVPNLKLTYCLAAQANQGSLHLSRQERAIAQQSSSQSYPDYATQSELLERRHRSRLFMARRPLVNMGVMPSVPQ